MFRVEVLGIECQCLGGFRCFSFGMFMEGTWGSLVSLNGF